MEIPLQHHSHYNPHTCHELPWVSFQLCPSPHLCSCPVLCHYYCDDPPSSQTLELGLNTHTIFLPLLHSQILLKFHESYIDIYRIHPLLPMSILHPRLHPAHCQSSNCTSCFQPHCSMIHSPPCHLNYMLVALCWRDKTSQSVATYRSNSLFGWEQRASPWRQGRSRSRLQELQVRSEFCLLGSRERERTRRVLRPRTLMPVPSEVLSPARFCIWKSQDFLNQHHQLGTKCSNTGVYGRHFSMPVSPPYLRVFSDSQKSELLENSQNQVWTAPTAAATRRSRGADGLTGYRTVTFAV